VVREQSDYYHATKTTIFNALLNTIDLPSWPSWT
jgi:pilus assembly protein CpaF